MDWGAIATLVAEVLFGGGLVVLVTLKDKKTAAILDNMQTVIEQEKALAESYKAEAKDLKAEIKEYQAAAKKQEEYIRTLHSEKSSLHEKLDKANSKAAVFKIVKCFEMGCGGRRPPLNENASETLKQIQAGKLGE